MSIFTPKSAIQFDNRLDLDPQKFERLMQAQGLSLPVNSEVRIPQGTLVTDGSGHIVEVFTNTATRVIKVKH